MKNIISASRRTDIPAFYGDWLMRRIRGGAAGVVNPFGGRKNCVSLKSEDVHFIVFWSRDYSPFLKHLEELAAAGYRFYFQFTINGYPRHLDPGAPPWEDAVAAAGYLSKRFSPEHVVWRFDPIIFSNQMGPDEVFGRFAALAAALEGMTKRCVFSFAYIYEKTRRNIEKLARDENLIFRAGTEFAEKFVNTNGTIRFDLTIEERIEFSQRMSEAAALRGISMYSCCGDYLLGDNPQSPVLKASCIDAGLIASITGDDSFVARKHPTRLECGCCESRDIGAYDTCPHGCVYCYANANRDTAIKKNALAAAEDTFALACPARREDFTVF